jgi:hypothetical protein
MALSRLLLTVVVGFAAILGGLYQFKLKEKLKIGGIGRVVENVGNARCKTYPDVQACESEWADRFSQAYTE